MQIQVNLEHAFGKLEMSSCGDTDLVRWFTCSRDYGHFRLPAHHIYIFKLIPSSQIIHFVNRGPRFVLFVRSATKHEKSIYALSSACLSIPRFIHSTYLFGFQLWVYRIFDVFLWVFPLDVFLLSSCKPLSFPLSLDIHELKKIHKCL